MESIVQIFKALGDETRLKILIILANRKICGKGIAKHIQISEAAVSQHIKVLKEAGIIVGVKRGYYIHYELQKDILWDLVHFIEQISQTPVIMNCKMDMDIPNECRALCKSNRNSCCKRDRELKGE
ncbi:ArsR family transcriptional regulator [Mobilisporobacter senegalensis]|uniref:ArsR family transcriptional regulator n=1 Tax=Mobilisporobacter senegalensis TaxID=1329262 RepID=A0A3N1XF18_9FIRM|nr:metalloregulator ArsR/SmtB family transcription factor [Mobilisporobacter senegalensis]ROR23397.1 ArsR family transcriptional regulator [Mobilisporobacter senegalensis]